MYAISLKRKSFKTVIVQVAVRVGFREVVVNSHCSSTILLWPLWRKRQWVECHMCRLCTVTCGFRMCLQWRCSTSNSWFFTFHCSVYLAHSSSSFFSGCSIFYWHSQLFICNWNVLRNWAISANQPFFP